MYLKKDIAEQGLWNFNIHVEHLAILLKLRFGFSRSRVGLPGGLILWVRPWLAGLWRDGGPPAWTGYCSGYSLLHNKPPKPSSLKESSALLLWLLLPPAVQLSSFCSGTLTEGSLDSSWGRLLSASWCCCPLGPPLGPSARISPGGGLSKWQGALHSPAAGFPDKCPKREPDRGVTFSSLTSHSITSNVFYLFHVTHNAQYCDYS